MLGVEALTQRLGKLNVLAKKKKKKAGSVPNASMANYEQFQGIQHIHTGRLSYT